MQKLHKHMIYMVAVRTLKKGGGGGMANGASKLLKQVSMYFYVRTKNFLFGTDYSVKLETTLLNKASKTFRPNNFGLHVLR